MENSQELSNIQGRMDTFAGCGKCVYVAGSVMSSVAQRSRDIWLRTGHVWQVGADFSASVCPRQPSGLPWGRLTVEMTMEAGSGEDSSGMLN